MCSKLNGRKRKRKRQKAQIDSLPRQDIITALVRSCMHDTPVGIRPIYKPRASVTPSVPKSMTREEKVKRKKAPRQTPCRAKKRE
jgi:hypothetical protein